MFTGSAGKKEYNEYVNRFCENIHKHKMDKSTRNAKQKVVKMGELSISALLIRFVLGGAAVVASTIVARRLGEKAGGIFAAFPAVFLAALLTAGLDLKGEDLVSQSIVLSKGAMVGMGINILVAIFAGFLLNKFGLKKGLIQVLGCWFVVSMVVVAITSY